MNPAVFLVAAALPFAEYVGAVDAAFDASALAAGLRQAQQGLEHAARERTAESPLRLSASAAATLSEQAGPGIPAVQPGFALGPTASAVYEPRSGFSATLSGSYSLAAQPADPDGIGGTQPFNVSLELRYDIVQGGRDGPAWVEASAAASSATAQGYTSAQRLLDERVAFGRLMIGIYSGGCAVELLARVRARIDETVASARLQLKTGILGQRDYLNFVALDNGFAAQQAQLEASLAEQRQTAHGFGAAAAQLSEGVPEASACDVDITATQVLARERLLGVSQLERSAAALPAPRAAQESARAAALSLDALQKRQRASVSPFVQGQLARSDYFTQTLAQVTAGVSLEWTVPGERRHHATQEAALGLASAESLESDALERAKATLRQLNTQLDSQVRVLDVLKKALDDSASLIEVLKAQQLIGAVDSLNFTSAYVNDVAIRQALLGAWRTVQQTVFALNAYERGSR